MRVVIHHNPACGTSRSTLALIRHVGIEPEIVEYLQTPPDRRALATMIAAAGLGVRDAIRAKEPLYRELRLDAASVDDEALLEAMVAHPLLINRPFVTTPLGTRLCRPSEIVLGLLPPCIHPFAKEDGEVVIDADGERAC